MSAPPASDSAYGLRGAALRGLRAGLVVAPVLTLGTLLLPEDGQIIAWGASLGFGLLLSVLGLVFYGLARAMMRLEARHVWKEPTVREPRPSMLRTERGLLWIGLPLLMSGLLLSAVLLARGENLF